LSYPVLTRQIKHSDDCQRIELFCHICGCSLLASWLSKRIGGFMMEQCRKDETPTRVNPRLYQFGPVLVRLRHRCQRELIDCLLRSSAHGRNPRLVSSRSAGCSSEPTCTNVHKQFAVDCKVSGDPRSTFVWWFSKFVVQVEACNSGGPPSI